MRKTTHNIITHLPIIKLNRVSAIIAADIHIRNTVPECRTDDFMAAQARKHSFLKRLQESLKCPILVAGDLFHHWKPSPELLSWTFRNLADGIVCIPGQHDLPAHNMENIGKAGIQVLAEAEKITLLTEPSVQRLVCRTDDIGVCGFPWGCDLEPITPLYEYNVALVHKLVYSGKPPFPGAENVGGTARTILNKMQGFDLIATGDNHQTIVEQTKNGRLLVNAGSFMRTTAAQADHKPCVFLWDAQEDELQQVFLPIEHDVVSREHIDVVSERDERISAFVERLNRDIEIGLSFESNLKEHIRVNKVKKAVQNIIWEAVHGERSTGIQS